MRPRKRFGQHFLHDAVVIARIIAAIDLQRTDRVLEIGPGLGAITLPLLQRLDRLDAVEIDRDAIEELRRRADLTAAMFIKGELLIHEADVLQFDVARLRGDGAPLRIVGNLPYNISTPLLFHLIDQRQHIRDLHFMLQKEVVERIAAAPGSKAYGRLTVMLAPWFTPTALFDIQKESFRPAPRVTSTYLRLVPHAQPPFELGDFEAYRRVVAGAFSQRRKTLRNALKSLLNEAQIEAAGIDPGLRAEVLAPPDFAAIARQL